MKYKLEIYWSNADKAFLAECPDLGLYTIGDSYEEALLSIKNEITAYEKEMKMEPHTQYSYLLREKDDNNIGYMVTRDGDNRGWYTNVELTYKGNAWSDHVRNKVQLKIEEWDGGVVHVTDCNGKLHEMSFTDLANLRIALQTLHRRDKADRRGRWFDDVKVTKKRIRKYRDVRK